MSEHTTMLCHSSDQLLEELLEEVTNRLQTGEPIDVDSYAAAHSEYAEELRRVIPAMQVLAAFAHSQLGSDSLLTKNEAPSVRELGDFRILRELGRGGMGVVYEAEQLSLGRRVALKVLPFAAMLDKQLLERFKNEARAAATLEHPHILAIYSVGVDRGVHYYAMQLADGKNLAQSIEQMRNSAWGMQPPQVKPPSQHEAASRPQQAAIDTVADISTVPECDTPAHFRSIAHLGIQAADALDHAHQNGIVHRDVKPGNLLVDEHGKLWVSDFGLARIETTADLTMTGDFVGTLRYMSPEQALGNRSVIDPRSDVYSLGATLYELLTLRPVFVGNDRQQILQQIASDNPPKPRHLNGRIPADFETIVTKALEKDPADRYQSAADLADDLKAFVEDRAITARPPSLATRATQWAKRHSTAVAAALGVLLLASIGLIFATATINRERATAIQNAQEAQENYRLALDAVDQMLARVGNEKLKNIPLVEEVRRELLEDAVRLYQRFLDREEGDPQVRVEMGIVHQRLAKLLHALGRQFEAETSIARSINLLKQAAREAPADTSVRLELARSLIAAGSVRSELRSFDEGISILRSLDAKELSSRAAAVELADSLNLLANLTEKT